ncbi:hypothetical protein NESM_000919500 [Novymonas esmeraldas]|uniref:Uncharacterized protein n=1 Tax=Novymonas esmeraldas TaxID=1808958 RepID=A0AAW0F2Z0_9TRYP
MMYADEVRGSLSTAIRNCTSCTPGIPHTTITCGCVLASASNIGLFSVPSLTLWGTAYSAGGGRARLFMVAANVRYSAEPKFTPLRYMKAVRRARMWLMMYDMIAISSACGSARVKYTLSSHLRAVDELVYGAMNIIGSGCDAASLSAAIVITSEKGPIVASSVGWSALALFTTAVMSDWFTLASGSITTILRPFAAVYLDAYSAASTPYHSAFA